MYPLLTATAPPRVRNKISHKRYCMGLSTKKLQAHAIHWSIIMSRHIFPKKNMAIERYTGGLRISGSLWGLPRSSSAALPILGGHSWAVQLLAKGCSFHGFFTNYMLILSIYSVSIHESLKKQYESNYIDAILIYSIVITGNNEFVFFQS